MSTQARYFYIPMSRFALMSILTSGLYDHYWQYKNWKYIKEREGSVIWPFWRGVFGLIFLHSLLKKLKNDQDMLSLQTPNYSPGGLTIGWVALRLIGNGFWKIDDPLGNFIGIIIDSITFTFLLPAQNYINRCNSTKTVFPFASWSSGHSITLVLGIIFWVLVLIGRFGE